MQKKRIITYMLLAGIFILAGTLIHAQPNARSFQLAFPLGANLAQVQGDPYQGYRKWGLMAGVEGIASLSKGKQLSLGMVFQQLGAVPSITERKQTEQNYIDMRISYIEVPLSLQIPLSQLVSKYRVDAEAGLSFARQLSSRVVRTTTVSGGNSPGIPYLDIVDRQPAFENFVWSGILGIGYYLHSQVALRFRYHHGVNAFYQPTPEDQEEGLKALRHRYLSLSVRYIIL